MAIKTTHVGSLPRSKIISDMLFEEERGEDITVENPEEILQREVVKVLQNQKDAGIDIPSDGEMSKISYATYIGKRVSGFAGDSKRIPPADLEDFPGYLKKIAESGGTPSYKRPRCIDKLGEYQPADLIADIKRMKYAMAKTGYTEGFMNSASPGVISLFQSTDYHNTHEQYLQDLADVMKHEYQIIVENGLYLQIDAPDLALGRHMMFKNLSDKEFVNKVLLHVEILNYTLKDIPKERVRLHVCWGNYEGPHHCDIEISKLFPVLFELNVGALLFEGANPRHSHEWESWSNTKIPDDLVLIPGVIDSTSNFIEHPSLVAQRLKRFINIVGPDRVIGGSDCGFSTFAGFGRVDEDIVYAKLKSLSEGAAIAAKN
jgi:5-methyltetrahydropteroyltriglutamate--homocysteine methyltransferase